MNEPTEGVPPVVGPPPPDPPPGAPPPPTPPPPSVPDDDGPGGDGPEGDGPDRRTLAIGALLGIIAVLLVALIIVRTGDDGDPVTTEPSTTTTTAPPTTASTTTTSTSSTTSTTTSSTTTTTTAPPTTAPTTTRPTTTTTTAPPATIAPARCTGATAPDDPDPVAQTFYDAWRVDDRECAEAIGAPGAIEDLFALDGSNTEWRQEPCEPEPEDDGDDGPASICTFRYEGGTAFFQLRFGATEGWQVTAIAFQVD